MKKLREFLPEIVVTTVLVAAVASAMAIVHAAPAADPYNAQFGAECTPNGDLFRLHVYFPKGLPAGVVMHLEKPDAGWCAAKKSST